MQQATIALIGIITVLYVQPIIGSESNLSAVKPVTRTEQSRSASKPPQRAAHSIEFKCDGRKHCSTMTSCEESKFFLKNCPDTRMDGDGDGIPCEDQWCGH